MKFRSYDIVIVLCFLYSLSVLSSEKRNGTGFLEVEDAACVDPEDRPPLSPIQNSRWDGMRSFIGQGIQQVRQALKTTVGSEKGAYTLARTTPPGKQQQEESSASKKGSMLQARIQVRRASTESR